MKKLTLLIASLFFTTLTHADNLCVNKGDVLFSCSIEKSKKSVSICKSGDIVSYVFGTTEKIDVTLPENGNKSLISLSYESTPTGESKGVVFTRGDYQYLVQNVFGGKPPTEWDEIIVTKTGKVITTLSCSNKQKTDGDIQGIFDSLKKKGFKIVES